MQKDERIKSFSIVEAAMKEKGVTMYRVAKDLNIPQSTLTDWKMGRSMPKMGKMVKIAGYLDIELKQFA